jgi:hypothetical protein
LAQICFTSLPNVRRFYFLVRLLARHTCLQQCLSKNINILVHSNWRSSSVLRELMSSS